MGATTPPPPVEARNLERIGYADCDGRPPFKLALTVVDDRWYLVAGHLWHRGWTILDVTDPTDPRTVAFVPGPSDTWTCQVQVADGVLLAGLARIPPRFGGDPSRSFEEAAIVFDISDPVRPVERSRLRFGGTGSHRNWWAGGRYAHLAVNVRGYANYLLVTVDLADPGRPREVGRWWLPGQGPGETPPPDEDGQSLHGPAYRDGDLAYLAYGGAGMVILDLADPAAPRLVGRMRVAPPFRGGLYGAGVHTARPLPRRGLAVVHAEAGAERCAEPLNLAGLADIRDPAHPALVSLFPRPQPSPGLPYRSYCDKGGRFGPHDSHLPQGSPWLEDRDDLVYLTWFNAGLRIYDIRDPREPAEIACYVPADPVTRHGPLPESGLVTQSETVLVDARGCIYLTDKNDGLTILRRTGPADLP